MDGDLGAMLQSVLSDPEQMAKIGQMAQSLMGNGGESPPPEPSEPSPAPSPPPSQPPVGEGRVLAALTKALSGGGGSSRSTALLTAMRPYLRPEKQAKLDRAMEIAKMARIAGMVMGQLGGDRNGL